MTRRRALTVVAALLAGGASALPAPAFARSAQLLPYPMADVWPSTIRYLRIDRGATLREKDADAGYVLFDLPEGSKTHKGALELVRTTDDDGRDATRVVVSLNDLPRHFETTLLDKLAAKIKEDHGAPVAPPPRRPAGEPAPKKPTPDAAQLPRPREGELPRPERR